jgi:hypothetical protein
VLENNKSLKDLHEQVLHTHQKILQDLQLT